MRRAVRSIVQCTGAIVGASGVAFAAYASHGSADQALAAPAAAILLSHGPTLLVLSVMADRAPRTIGSIATIMLVGVLLFAGDLAARIFLGGRLFEGAAPIGGGAIMISWLLLAIEAPIAAFRGKRKRRPAQGPARSRTP